MITYLKVRMFNKSLLIYSHDSELINSYNNRHIENISKNMDRTRPGKLSTYILEISCQQTNTNISIKYHNLRYSSGIISSHGLFEANSLR